MDITRIFTLAAMLALPAFTVQQQDFIKVAGTALVQGERSYRTHGVNLYDLLQWYLYPEPGRDRQQARAILQKLSEHGFNFVRIAGSPYYPAQFSEAFFDPDPDARERKREKFYLAFDAMIADLAEYGITADLALVWCISNFSDLGHHSLHEAIVNSDSAGFAMMVEYITLTASRYASTPSVAIWSIGNEYNLFADLQMENGVLEGSSEGSFYSPGPLVRDGRNNFTSAELASFYSRIIARIRSADPNHIIATGGAEPRPQALHLLRAAESGNGPDWTSDTPEECEEYLRLITGDADVVSTHFYQSDLPLSWYANAASRMGKPLYVPEAAPAFSWKKDGEGNYYIAGGDYAAAEGIADLKAKVQLTDDQKIPIVVWWNYSPNPPFLLWHSATDAALDILEDANRASRY